MTEAEKKMKKYTRAVNRKLNLPSDVKKRVMTDFTSSIQSRKEAGKTDEEIYAELGSPADVAADLNEQMKEFAYIKSPWRWVCFAQNHHIVNALHGLHLSSLKNPPEIHRSGLWIPGPRWTPGPRPYDRAPWSAPPRSVPGLPEPGGGRC